MRLPHAWYIPLALLVCSLIFATSNVLLSTQEKSTQAAFASVEQARAQLAADPLPNADTAVPTLHANLEPVNWPLRADVNEVLRHAGETAQTQGVALRTISVSHQDASVQAWGRVTLDVSAFGRYAALKAWQSAMQKDFSSLSVQSLRLQGNPSSGSGDLDAQAIWVMHVRD
jgi:hypothetical protein